MWKVYSEGYHREETCTSCELIQSACEIPNTLSPPGDMAPHTERRPVPSCETYIGADDDNDIRINYF